MEKLELKIKTGSNADITTNILNVKNELLNIVSYYADLTYTEDSVKTAKEDRAMLNKVSKYFNDERLKAEKEYMKSFNIIIKEPLSELVKIAKDTSDKIDSQIKKFEEEEIKEKEILINNIYELLNTDYDFKHLNSKDYLLKSMTEDKIKLRMLEKINKYDEDLEILKTQNPIDFNDIRDFYLNNNYDVRLCIQEIQRINKIAENVITANKVETIISNIDEEVEEFTLTLFATKTQLEELKQFLKRNNIKSL